MDHQRALTQLRSRELLSEALIYAIFDRTNGDFLFDPLEIEYARSNSETLINELVEELRKDKRYKLFPIRLADYETLRDWRCFDADTGKDLAVEVREFAMPNDFSNWKNHKAFESAFARLQKDLKDEGKPA